MKKGGNSIVNFDDKHIVNSSRAFRYKNFYISKGCDMEQDNGERYHKITNIEEIHSSTTDLTTGRVIRMFRFTFDDGNSVDLQEDINVTFICNSNSRSNTARGKKRRTIKRRSHKVKRNKRRTTRHK